MAALAATTLIDFATTKLTRAYSVFDHPTFALVWFRSSIHKIRHLLRPLSSLLYPPIVSGHPDHL
jgi:hypothetical protein